MISDKLTAKIKKIPYGAELSIIDRRNPRLLDACIALGRVDLIRAFNDQAFTDEILDYYGTRLAQYIRKASRESERLASYYFEKGDLRTAFKCLSEKIMTRPFLNKYGDKIIEGLKQPRYISHTFFGNSKLLYKYLVENKEYGLALSDEFYKYNKHLANRIGLKACADAVEKQYSEVPQWLTQNKELFNELLNRKNYNLVMSFDSSLITDEILEKYKDKFIETILSTGKVNLGVRSFKTLAEHFRENQNYKILIQFYGYHFELTQEEFNTFVHEMDVTRSVPSICKGNEALFKHYLEQKNVELLFQFNHDLIKKYDVYNTCINEIINYVRSRDRVFLSIHLSNENKIAFIEHDAVDVIIKISDNASYSLISNEEIMDKYGAKVLNSIKALGLDSYYVNDPMIFKSLLKYEQYEYLLRADEKILKKYLGSEHYPGLAKYLKENKNKFNVFLRRNRDFFNYCMDNKYYDLALSFNYYFLTPRIASGKEKEIIDCIVNDHDYPNLFRENEELAYHLYDYAVKNKRYDFLFEHCSDRVFLKMFDRYASPEERELEEEFLSRTGLSREEVHERLKKLLKTNDDIFKTINPMILSHKYDVIDESELKKFVMYPDIQKRIISLNERELVVLNVILKKIDSKKVKIDRSNLINNIIKNLHKYESIIKDINDELNDEEFLEKLICVLNDSSNYYGINSIEDLKAYDEKILEKNQLIEEQILSGRLDIFGLREAVFRKKLGISLEEANFIFKRYCEDIEAVNDSNLSREIKIVLNEVKNIFGASKDELGFMFLSSKNSITNKHKYDSLESIIRTNYAKLYNDCLYKPREEDVISPELKNKYFAKVKVPVYMPTGDFNMQTHSLGAYREFHEPLDWKTDWNRPKTTYHGICTTLISNDLIAPARSYHPIYGFSHYKENEMLCVGNYDLNSDRAISKYDTSRAFPYSFYTPKHLINKTRHTHNEIVIERISDSGKRQPDYVVYIVDDINDSRFFHPQNKKFQEIVRAAEDHNVPIIVIDRLHHAKRSLAMIQNMKQEMAIDFEKFANEGKVKELLFKYLNNRIGCIKYNSESNSEVYKYFTDEMCIKAINDIWEAVEAAPDSSAKCSALKQIIYVLSNEYTNWCERKLESNAIGWIINAANNTLRTMDSKYHAEEEYKQNAVMNAKNQKMYIYEVYTKYPEFREVIKRDLNSGIELSEIVEKIKNNEYYSQVSNSTPSSRGG